MKIAFFGTGLLGEPMARQLLEAEHELIVFNRTKSKTAALEKEGAEVMEKAPEAVEKADLLITMLTGYPAIHQVLFPEPGPGLKGKTLIQMGTISPPESVQLKELMENAGGEYMEAPVLGSIPQAKTKTLFVIFGGTETQLKKWSHILKVFGDKVIHMGGVGQAAAAKLALNQLIASLTAAFSMSLGYLREKGGDIEKFMDILRESALYAPTFDKKFDRMMQRNFDNPNFPVKHLLKDVQLMAADFSKENIDTAPLEGVKQVLLKAVADDLSDLDYSALYNTIHPIS